MALDTTSKRRSSIGLLQPWQPNIPSPLSTPGVVDQADQQQMAWTYSGIVAGPLVPILVCITIAGTFTGVPVLSATWRSAVVMESVLTGTASLEGTLRGEPCLDGTLDAETALLGDWSSATALLGTA